MGVPRYSKFPGLEEKTWNFSQSGGVLRRGMGSLSEGCGEACAARARWRGILPPFEGSGEACAARARWRGMLPPFEGSGEACAARARWRGLLWQTEGCVQGSAARAPVARRRVMMVKWWTRIVGDSGDMLLNDWRYAVN